MSVDAGERREYPMTVGRSKRPTKGQLAIKAAEVGAALAVAGGGTALIAKGIHDNQQEYAARLDYNVQNRLNEQKQERHHTKYFKERREDDGYSVSSEGKRIEVFNRIILNEGENLNVFRDPSQTSDRVEDFKPAREFDGSILGVPVYGDPFLTNDGKGMGEILLKFGDKRVDQVGYYQKIKGTVDGKEAEAFVREDSSLHVVKSIKDPTRNQGVIKVDLTKK